MLSPLRWSVRACPPLETAASESYDSRQTSVDGGGLQQSPVPAAFDDRWPVALKPNPKRIASVLHDLAKAAASTAALSLFLAGAATAQVSFTDHGGKLIEFDSPPERLVSIIRSGPIVYTAIDGTTEHIAGMNADTHKRFDSNLYDELVPALRDIPANVAREGFQPNVEAILALNPDAVLQWSHRPGVVEPLERVGLKVVGWHCCTEEQRLDYLRFSGYMSGKINRAQMVLKMQADSNEALRETFADEAPDDYVTLLEVDQVENQIRVIANSSRNYSLSGIKNLASDDSGEWWRTIDVEQFLVWDPDIIVLSGWQRTLFPDDLYNHPLLASVKAVKNKRVYRIPMFNADPDAPEIHLTAQWLARIGTPERFDDDFRETVRETYEAIYKHRPDDDLLDQIFEMEANQDAAGYQEQFGS